MAVAAEGEAVTNGNSDEHARRRKRPLQENEGSDDDESGLVDRFEFAKACREMGCVAPDAALDALFDSFDLNGNFTIEYSELHSILSDNTPRRTRHMDALKEDG